MNRKEMENLQHAAKKNTKEEMRLKEHVEDSQLMLAYAAENGTPVNSAIVKDIVSSLYHLQNGTFDQENEIIFWNAFNLISKEIKPVCINSLKATKNYNSPSNKSQATKTVFFYQSLTFFTLITLLVIQVYWLIGSIIIAQITQNQSFQEEIAKLRILAKEQYEISKIINNEETCVAQGELFNKFDDKQKDIEKDTEIYYQLLKIWYSPVAIITNWISTEVFNRNKYPSGDETREIVATDKIDNYLEFGYIKARRAAQFILQPIQQYILPLLYGWIGALAYVLRSINREIADITYTNQSKEHYRLRTQLGALSGLAVGWFLSVDVEHYATQPSLSFGNLSPLALSFLAGYSVELLFSAMDKIVEAFSAKPSSQSNH
jgi:hypothetical protein